MFLPLRVFGNIPAKCLSNFSKVKVLRFINVSLLSSIYNPKVKLHGLKIITFWTKLIGCQLTCYPLKLLVIHIWSHCNIKFYIGFSTVNITYLNGASLNHMYVKYASKQVIWNTISTTVRTVSSSGSK